jgi:hypothetical protein
MGGFISRSKHGSGVPNDEDDATLRMRLRQCGEANIPSHEDRSAHETRIEHDRVRR